MGLVKRPYYKKQRAPARTKGVLRAEVAPVALPEANSNEVALALFALAEEAGVVVGRAGGYDRHRDEYTVVGKCKRSGKAQDFIIKGAEVADLILLGRLMNGGPMVRRGADKRRDRNHPSGLVLR